MNESATGFPTLQNRKIVLGVTGGIAAYKSALLARELVRRGAQVRVVMTRSAQQFVAPLTFATLTQAPVCTTLWEASGSWSMEHITNARWGDLLLVAPATANIVGKFANGIADDALSTLYLAWRRPVTLAPAMNTAMYEHPAYRANEATLRERGVEFVDPEAGSLACGEEGAGRLADVSTIIRAVEGRLLRSGPLQGRRVLVTAGPTREYIDPVRYITNPSSGKMGFALAEAAARMGAHATVVTGPVALETPPGVERIDATDAEEMADAVLSRCADYDLLIFAAAVADYTPETRSDRKIKKGGDFSSIALRRTPDIAGAFAERKRDGQVSVGFAVDTDDALETAREKMRKKKFDLIFANPLDGSDSAFGADTNRGWLIRSDGEPEALDRASKSDIADRIMVQAAEILRTRRGE